MGKERNCCRTDEIHDTLCKDYSQAVKILLDIGPKLVAVTLGSEGVLLATKQRQEKLPGFKVKAIDTTGAGDSFWGGF